MAKQYPGPDEWLAQTQVPPGIGTGTEPLKQSLVATNRASHQAVQIASAIRDSLGDFAGKVLTALINHRWVYGNQEKVPEKDRGTNNLFESTAAINTLVYSQTQGLPAILGLLRRVAAEVGVTPETWTVRAGDTVNSIAAATGVAAADIVTLNNLVSPDRIEVGQVLKLQP